MQVNKLCTSSTCNNRRLNRFFLAPPTNGECCQPSNNNKPSTAHQIGNHILGFAYANASNEMMGATRERDAIELGQGVQESMREHRAGCAEAWRQGLPRPLPLGPLHHQCTSDETQ